MTTYRAVTEQECDRLLALCEQKDLEIAKLQRAVEWCMRQMLDEFCVLEWDENGVLVSLITETEHEVPAEFADIIKPRESGDAHTGEKP